MRNRVQLLKSQLQKEKDAIDKHKSLTKEVVQQKIEYNKLYSIVTFTLFRKKGIIMPLMNKLHHFELEIIPFEKCIKIK